MSEDELVTAWVEGNREAAAALIELHYDAVVRFFRTKSGTSADDLVQRTFLACHEARDRYRGATSFRSFLFGVARNVLFEHIRGRVRDRREDPDFGVTSLAALDPGLSTQLAQRAEHRQLILALQQLPAELQIALELYYWEELSIAELATATGVPEGTAKSRLFRARAELRDTLQRTAATEGDRARWGALIDAWEPPR
jgi:RNA polymerase sigma-70 factor (ECF subfamily)